VPPTWTSRTERLADRLIAADKDFELLIVPELLGELFA
jgi:hypothetical protein